ncbi:Mitochondrial import inner membrane translocase subunit tim23 [Coemansia thaxteri]|uniref:Mitochondrial import inner membrane translocase subunit tim23 n=1 Tax=Coemansia thaxteri TaxID=2663907 RepID=A0A9W8ELP0_9FUNG|nr:Mitochondrial import inner membrane translocase subunit tim23 [Coemansia thaxteri]KAJ2007237.1 Mitochondrial import inner membrane translocase subunit tim23 [Coemansia thaxteri]KAJ2473005.1 Mitochondrial import inner membrane translocase subunit tim23 [Coemansia sp. RSA 2322]KAJ2486414.1 Mitochondrial import inner membrane translocase subunit tim23 [Coemansia sp. RSA 2320]
MSIFSVLSRNRTDSKDRQPQEQGSADAASSTALLSDQQVDEKAKGYYQTAPAPAASHAMDQVQGGVSEFLSQVDFSSPHLNPVASPGGIEYLSIEDGPTYAGGVVPSRGWSDDLCYGTGTMYILGLTSGGAWGFIEGMRSQHGANFKLRLNSVLNSMTRRGPFVGNSLGILGMFYNSINSMIGSYRGTRDQYNSLGAAAISGMLFKIGGGPRASLVSALICTGAVGTYHAAATAYAGYRERRMSDSAFSSPPAAQLAQPAAL